MIIQREYFCGAPEVLLFSDHFVSAFILQKLYSAIYRDQAVLLRAGRSHLQPRTASTVPSLDQCNHQQLRVKRSISVFTGSKPPVSYFCTESKRVRKAITSCLRPAASRDVNTGGITLRLINTMKITLAHKEIHYNPREGSPRKKKKKKEH